MNEFYALYLAVACFWGGRVYSSCRAVAPGWTYALHVLRMGLCWPLTWYDFATKLRELKENRDA